MHKITAFTDGSFNDGSGCHGGIVYWDTQTGKPISCVHVTSHDPRFVSMRNVGGELLAAWCAIVSAANVANEDEPLHRSYELDIIYDLKGVGEWAKGVWKCNKPGTQWYYAQIKGILKQTPSLKVNFIWVKGHENTAGNIWADKVAGYDMSYAKANDIPICCLDECLK